MAEQALNRLCVLVLIYKESCEAMPQIMETEPLSRPEHNPGRDSSWTEMICCKNASRSWLTPLQSGRRKNPVARLRVRGLLVPTL